MGENICAVGPAQSPGEPVMRYLARPPEEPGRSEGGGAGASELAGRAQGLCAWWLLDYLAEAGPSRPREAVAAGEEAGFSRRSVYRARQALGERIVDLGIHDRDPAKRWAVAGG